jgi:hypothetical protein
VSAYRVAALSAAALVVLSTVVFRVVEGWSWVDALYFSVVAVTTVGFGDLTPTTNLTKLFTVFYVLAGATVLGMVLHERLRRHHRAIARMVGHERHEQDERARMPGEDRATPTRGASDGS